MALSTQGGLSKVTDLPCFCVQLPKLHLKTFFSFSQLRKLHLKTFFSFSQLRILHLKTFLIVFFSAEKIAFETHFFSLFSRRHSTCISQKDLLLNSLKFFFSKVRSRVVVRNTFGSGRLKGRYFCKTLKRIGFISSTIERQLLKGRYFKTKYWLFLRKNSQKNCFHFFLNHRWSVESTSERAFAQLSSLLRAKLCRNPLL